MAQAEADLKTARDNLVSGNYYVVALFCQQTVEKGLKALYLHQSRAQVPKTHSLPRLAKEVDLPEKFRKAIDLINPSYVFSRYPDLVEDIPAEMYTKESVAEMLAQTEVLFAWIQKQF